jgi:hypothetical protein
MCARRKETRAREHGASRSFTETDSWPLRAVLKVVPHFNSDLGSATLIATMLFPSFGTLAAASSLLSMAVAHNIQMKAHMRECFHESLHKDDKMTVTFQVGDREFGGSGNLEIDFWVCHRDQTNAWQKRKPNVQL